MNSQAAGATAPSPAGCLASDLGEGRASLLASMRHAATRSRRAHRISPEAVGSIAALLRGTSGRGCGIARRRSSRRCRSATMPLEFVSLARVGFARRRLQVPRAPTSRTGVFDRAWPAAGTPGPGTRKPQSARRVAERTTDVGLDRSSPRTRPPSEASPRRPFHAVRSVVRAGRVRRAPRLRLPRVRLCALSARACLPARRFRPGRRR